MQILRQLGIILFFGFLGEILSRFFPLGMPASVLGLLLMLAALGLKLLRPESIGTAADYLSVNMSFFFLPAAAMILENYAYIEPVLVQVILICVITTVLTFFATYGTVRLFRMILKKAE
jgi:holin-like protein